MQLASLYPHYNASSNSQNEAQWVRAGQSVSVGGIRIDEGLLYVGERLATQDGQRDETFLVHPSLLVARHAPDFEGTKIGFWPDYAQMAPNERLAFLRWIAEGRKNPAIHPAYVLLHLYGLERRLILDRALDEAREILIEVQRIAARYVQHDSVRKALRGLAEAASVILTGALPAPILLGENVVAQISPTVIHAIGKLVAAGRPIDPDLIFAWVMSDPTRSFGMPERVAVMREGFRRHVEMSRPNGIFFDLSGTPPLGYIYHAQSGSFAVVLDDFLESVPDITRNAAARMEAHALVRDALERHHRFNSRRPTVSPSPAIANPSPTAPAVVAVPHGKHVLQKWAQEHINLDGSIDGSISIRVALKRWRGQSPKMLVRSEIERLADIFAQIGLGMVPDPRFDLEPPRITEDALLFQLAEEAESLEPAGEDYQTALLLVMVAMSVAKSDGDVARVEVEFIDQLIGQTQGLTESDRRRLLAECHWMQMRPLPLSPVFDAIGRLPDRQKREMANIVVEAAMADGHVPDAERAFAKAVLTLLGLSAGEATRRLALTTTSSFLGEPVRHEPTGNILEELDATILDTDVASFVAVAKETQAEESEFFGILSEPSSSPDLAGCLDQSFAQPSTDADAWSLDALDEKHRRLLAALLEQVEWNRKALERIARTQRLMPDGALETINDWTHHAIGELLFEVNDDTVHLNQSISSLLRGIVC